MEYIEKEPEIVESPYEIHQRIIDIETIQKVCELLALNPNIANSITIEASGMLNGKDCSNVLTVKQIRETVLATGSLSKAE